MKFMKRLLAGAMAVNMLSNYSSVLRVVAEGEESTEPQTEEVAEAPAEEVSEPAVYEEAPAEVYEEEPAPEAEPEQEQTYEEAPAPEETVTEETVEEVPAEPEETVEETEAAPETKTMTFEVIDGYGFVVKTNATVTDADKRETKLEQTITDAGEFVTVWAVPADGFEVDYWELDGVRLEETEKVKVEAYEIALDQDHHYTVHFKKQAAVEEEEKRLDEASAPIEEEAEETEEAFTPVTYTATSGNNVIVTVVDSEGAFPKGTTMKVTEVPAEQVFDAVNNAVEGEVQKVKAVDITFYDVDGNPIEPSKPVQVSMKTFGMNNASENQSVVHIDDNNNASVVADANTAAGMTTAEFESDAFSVYVVVETGEDARLTVNFVQAGGNTASMMINKRQADTHIEQYIYDPGTGELEPNEIFLGWTSDENYTASTTALTIADVRKEVKAKVDAGITEGAAVTYYAMLFKSYNIVFRDEKGVTVKTDRVMFRSDDKTASHNYTINLPYTPYVNTEEDTVAEFMGWDQLDETGKVVATHDNGTEIPVDSNILLKAHVEKGYWLSFNENLRNASYTQPEFVSLGKKPTVPDAPTRTGYRFDGWYTEDASDERDGQVAGEEFDFTKELKKNTVVYGKWTQSQTASYSVVIWQESLAGNGKDYDFVESVPVNNATVGSTPNTVVPSGNGARINGRNYSYTGFHFKETDQDQKTVAAEGNTVVNVYFDRTEYTLTFRESTYGGQVYKTITAKYGQNIRDEFPITTNQRDRWSPQNSSTFKQVLVYVDVMPAESVTFVRQAANFSIKTIHYFVEAKPGEKATRTYNGLGFVEYKAIDACYNFFTEAEDYIELDGFKKGDEQNRYPEQGYYTQSDWKDPDDADRSGNRVWENSNMSNVVVYYTRNTYDIVYRDGVYEDGDHNPINEDKLPDSYFEDATDIKYEASIKDKGDYTPTRDGYVFLGWYADDTCETAYDFTTMPSHNVTVYAKWVSREYKVELHPNDSADDRITYSDGTSDKKPFYVDYNEKIGNPGGERQAYDLVGWYTDSALKHGYDYDAFVLNDNYIKLYGDPNFREEGWPSVVGKLDLYAKWRSKLDGASGIHVVYDATDKGTDAPTDSEQYTDKAEAVVAGAATAKDTENMVFSHWVLQEYKDNKFQDTTTILFPGDTFEVLLANARVEDRTPTEDNPDTKVYTVQLRAEYIEKDKETLTFINWYDNYTGGLVHKSENLKINQATPIPAAPTRTGYEFTGWIRGIEEDGPTTTLTDLWLTYDKEAKAYKYNGAAATEVAADENLVGDGKHHALYAKWEPIDVNYKVEFYYQNDNGEGYTQDTTLAETRQAKTDSTVNATDADKAQTKDDKYKLNSGSSTLSATVKGDGTTVLKLYFDLNKVPVTVEHYLNGQTTAFKTNTVADQIVGSEYTPTPETTYEGKTLTVDHYDPSAGKITVQTKDNLIKIYYTLPLTITAKTDSKTYDGKPLNGEYTITGNLDADEEAIKNALGTAPSITDVSESPKNYLTTEEQAAITGIPAYYTVTYTPGTLTINPRTVTLTSADGEKVYDGKPLTKNAQTDVTVGGDGFVSGEGATYNITGTQTEVGSSANTFTYTLNAGTKADNYTITKTEGTLKVTELTDKVTVTITENSGSEKYDGKEKTVTGYTVSIDNKLYTEKDFTFSGTATVKGTDAGSYPMELKATDFTNNNKNFKNVEFVIVDGTLEISKRTVTLTSATDTKKYDGNPLTNDKVTVGGDGFAEGEGAEYDVTGTQTVPGTSANAFTYTLNEGTKADNYTITKTEGTLTVTNRDAKYEITVKANSATAQYDGKDHAAVGFEKLTFTVEGNDYTVSGLVTEDPSEKNAGTYSNNITGTAVVTDAAGNDVTSQFAVKTVDGSLVITKRTVTLTSADGEKVYDGTPLTKNAQTDVTVGGDGFAEGEGATYNITGTQTLVGSSANTFTYTLNEGTIADNYTITKTEGTLTVTDGTPDKPVDDDLVVTKTAGDGPYDLGAEVTFTVTATNIYADARTITLSEIPGVTLAQSEFKDVAGGATINTTATYTITEADILAGKFTNTVTAKIGELEKTAKASVDTTKASAAIEVTKTADKASYQYNDTIKYTIVVENTGNVTVKDITVTDELTGGVTPADKFELAPGASKTLTAEYTVAPEDTEKGGKIVNIAKASGTGTNNQAVSAEGKVEVTAKKIDITITAASDKKVYDGTELTNAGWELTSGKLVDGDKITSVTVTGSQTLVGESNNVASEAKIVRNPKVGFFLFAVKDGEDVTKGYNITYAPGKLTVTDGTDPGDKPVDDDLVVTKEVAEDKKYDLDEEVTFNITATNIYAEAKTIKLSEIEGVELEQDTFENVPAGETIETTATYKITEKDILAGKFVNTVTAAIDKLEKKAEATAKTAEKKPSLKVEKTTTSEPENGASYKVGETITYNIHVENDGNVTINAIDVKDDLTGDAWTIESLKPGESRDFTAKYTVTDQDAKNGVVKNAATAEGKDPEDKPTPGTGTTEDPTVGHMTVTKTVTSKAPEGRTSYRPGETIEYKIEVLNDGKVALKNITVTDELTGDKWTIETLEAGASKTFTAKHVVTEAEAKAGSVKNVAAATAKDPDGNDPEIIPGETETKTEPTPAKVPNTSDHNRTPGYLAMLMISILTGMFAFSFRKRYE